MFQFIENMAKGLQPYAFLIRLLSVIFALITASIVFSNHTVLDRFVPLLAILTGWSVLLAALISAQKTKIALVNSHAKGVLYQVKRLLMLGMWNLMSGTLVVLLFLFVITSIRVLSFTFST